jgi:hypothetical protein
MPVILAVGPFDLHSAPNARRYGEGTTRPADGGQASVAGTVVTTRLP